MNERKVDSVILQSEFTFLYFKSQRNGKIELFSQGTCNIQNLRNDTFLLLITNI